MKKTTIKSRLMDLFEIYGKDTPYPEMKELYKDKYGQKLGDKSYYAYRIQYRLLHHDKPLVHPQPKPNLFHREEVCHQPQAEQETSYYLSELRQLKDLAKKMGGLEYVKKAVEALQELQE